VFLHLMGLLAAGLIRRESITVDEVAQVGTGVSYLQMLDLRMNQEHPALPMQRRTLILAVLPALTFV
jgi:hypothetical protein